MLENPRYVTTEGLTATHEERPILTEDLLTRLHPLGTHVVVWRGFLPTTDVYEERLICIVYAVTLDGVEVASVDLSRSTYEELPLLADLMYEAVERAEQRGMDRLEAWAQGPR